MDRTKTARPTLFLSLLALLTLLVVPSCAEPSGGQSGSGLSCGEISECGPGLVCIAQECVVATIDEACESLDSCGCLASAECVAVTEECFCASEDTTCSGFEDQECICSGGAYLGCEAQTPPPSCEALDACGCLADPTCTAVTETCFCPSVDTTCSGFENEECICSGGAFIECVTTPPEDA